MPSIGYAPAAWLAALIAAASLGVFCWYFPRPGSWWVFGSVRTLVAFFASTAAMHGLLNLLPDARPWNVPRVTAAPALFLIPAMTVLVVHQLRRGALSTNRPVPLGRKRLPALLTFSALVVATGAAYFAPLLLAVVLAAFVWPDGPAHYVGGTPLAWLVILGSAIGAWISLARILGELWSGVRASSDNASVAQ